MSKTNKYNFLNEINGLTSSENQLLRKAKSKKMLPDYGHYRVKNPVDHLFLAVEKTIIYWTEREGYIGFEVEGHAGTVIVSVEEAMNVKARGGSFYAEVKPSPEEGTLPYLSRGIQESSRC